MKRIILFTAHGILVIQSVFAQLPLCTGLPGKSFMPTVFASKPTGVPTSAAHPDAYAPLNNEPFFPGGQKALEAYLDQADIYPYRARMINLEGTVRVGFRVQANGSLTDIRVIRSHGPLLDLAAIQAVVQMPRWYPAHREGVAVSHLLELAITFRLD